MTSASSSVDTLVQWLRDRAHDAGAHGFVVGLSGGIDSAVVARLCQMATPNRVLGVILPCYSHAQDEADAHLLARTFAIPAARVDLGATFDALTGELHAAVKGWIRSSVASTMRLSRTACSAPIRPSPPRVASVLREPVL